MHWSRASYARLCRLLRNGRSETAADDSSYTGVCRQSHFGHKSECGSIFRRLSKCADGRKHNVHVVTEVMESWKTSNVLPCRIVVLRHTSGSCRNSRHVGIVYPNQEVARDAQYYSARPRRTTNRRQQSCDERERLPV